jgi:hypothetical protein
VFQSKILNRDVKLEEEEEEKRKRKRMSAFPSNVSTRESASLLPLRPFAAAHLSAPENGFCDPVAVVRRAGAAGIHLPRIASEAEPGALDGFLEESTSEAESENQSASYERKRQKTG